MMKKTEFYSLLKQVPKAEIHVHIEAVISLASVKKLYRKKNAITMTPEAVKTLFSYSDLSGFIRAFLQVQDLLTSVDDFDLIFSDFANYLEKNGVNYCEAFFAPSAFIKKGFSYPAIMENFHRNIQKIKKEKNITIKLLIDVSRTFGLVNAENNLNMLLENRIPEVIGIGLGGDEKKGPCKEFGSVFEKARAAGLHTVVHAGEDVGPESIWDAINILHSERIGHGITAIQDTNLMDYLKETQLPLEICPTSNVFTRKVVKKIEDHPVRTFYDRGLNVTINTDDPVFFKITLLDEYWSLYTKLHFSEAEIKQIILNGYNASFLSAAEKKKHVAEVNTSWQGLMHE
jgi:adenosine deaminase